MASEHHHTVGITSYTAHAHLSRLFLTDQARSDGQGRAIGLEPEALDVRVRRNALRLGGGLHFFDLSYHT